MLKTNFLARGMLIIFLVCLAVITGVAVDEALAKEKKNITIVLWHTLKPSEEGFKRVVERVYDVNWNEVSAQQSKEKLDEILKGVDPKKTDLIYTYGTTVTLAAKKTIKDIPIVFNIVYHPIGAGIIDSWEHSGGNIVGGSINVPAEAQIKTLRTLVNFKKLGILNNPKEKQAAIGVDEFKALQDKFGYSVVVADFSSPEELANAMRVFDEAKVDAVMCTSASMILTNAEAVANAFTERKLIALSPVLEVAQKGVLIGLGANYAKLGEKVGEIALRVLKGEKANDIPSATLEKFDMIVNLKSANKMGIEIPVKILKIATEIIK